MKIFLHGIETVVPDHAYAQTYARGRMQGWLASRRARRLAGAIYDRSGIDCRHSVLPDFTPGATPLIFHETAEGRLLEPTTGARNGVFAEASRRLSVESARKVLAATGVFRAADITHVVTVSCTGFYNPGPDYDIVRGLGLRDSVERYHLGFMGCYAAFPALKMARQFCLASRDAVVLVVCIEMCSLHLQVREEPDALLANAIFADGVAAALVSARPPAAGKAAFLLDDFHSALIHEGRGDMAWEIGDRGFNIRLSTYVPDLIGANIAGMVEQMLTGAGLSVSDIGIWAIHPGGRAILDRIESALHLRPEQIHAARETLRRYGNMSSATVLFVLKAILETAAAGEGQSICAMAFGPGLTVESALLRLVPASAGAHVEESHHVLAGA